MLQLNNILEFIRNGRFGFDFDGVLSTQRGQTLWRNTKGEKWVITARSTGSGEFWRVINNLNIDRNKVIFTGSNKRKVETIKRLGIGTFYDNNEEDVIKKIPGIGKLF